MSVVEKVSPTVVADLSTSMILKRAREVLWVMGWCQGQYEDRAGALCVSAALHAVSPYPLQVYRAARALCDVTGRDSVPAWNDDYLTTWESVEYAFDQAIKSTTPKEEINGI